MATPTPVRDDAPPAPDRPTRRRRGLVVVAALTVAVALFLGVTGVVGLPAPGALRRHPYRELHRLAERINTDAGAIRTPDDCWRQLYDREGPLREIAAVDHLRSRVVVRIYSGNRGSVDPTTYNAVVERVDGIITAAPSFSWGMVQLEASPDGWSPLVSCRLVTRGYDRSRD